MTTKRTILAAALLAALMAVAPAQAHLRAGGAFGGVSKTSDRHAERDRRGGLGGGAPGGRPARDRRARLQRRRLGAREVTPTSARGASRTGTRAASSASARPAANSGVAVIDATRSGGCATSRDCANPSGASAEDVVVYDREVRPARRPRHRGRRDPGLRRPAHRHRLLPRPAGLGRDRSGAAEGARPPRAPAAARAGCTSSRSRTARRGRTYVYASVPTSEYADERLAQRTPRPRRAAATSG